MPLLQTLVEQKLKCAFAYAGPVASIVFASLVYRPHRFYIISLVCGLFVSVILVDAVNREVIVDNAGVSSRAATPVKYWFRLSLWIAAYLFVTYLPAGFALQEISK